MFELARFSGGHPYLIQLVGDELYQRIAEVYDPLPSMQVCPTSQDILYAQERSLIAYKRDVLDDVMSGAKPATKEYVRTAWEARGGHGIIQISDINAKLAGTAKALASRRNYAVNTQVLRGAGRGRLTFTLPHFDLVYQTLEDEGAEPSDEEWEY